MGTNERQTGDGDVAFSRSPIGGKKDDSIRFRCASELKEAMDALAHELGFHSSNELHELICAIMAFGEGHCERVAVDRIRKVAKLVPNLRETTTPPVHSQADIGILLENLGRQLQSIGGRQ